MDKFVIGIDYGTLSARALLVRVSDGAELASAELVYPHGVMAEADICGTDADATTALEDPEDYLEALSVTVREVVKKSGVSVENIVGLCLDCTASTPLPYLKDGTALASMEKFKSDPQAYIKLWKHHGAEPEAELMTRLAKERGEEWLSDYGGVVSAEWFFPKLAELARRSPEVFAAAERYGEAAEWLCGRITGSYKRSACFAGYKSLWSAERGYPSEYLCSIFAGERAIGERLDGEVMPLGSVIGYINAEGEALTGLKVGTAVATPVVDAHAALPAARVTHAGDLMVILGTSACHIVLSEENVAVGGICGKVDGGVVPGFYAYEAGQPCVGDMLGWFVESCLAKSYAEQAERLGLSKFDYLNSLAEKIEIEKLGLVALDWWNGNRSPYVNYDLSGMLVGLTLKTKPEEIYLALLSSIAYGTRRLVELYRKSGVSVERITAAGGISVKNPLFMQLLADAVGMDISVTDTKQAGAKGSAIYAAVAAGIYPTVAEAAERMGEGCSVVYSPRKEQKAAHDGLYEIYCELSEQMAYSDIMKRLRG